MRKPAYVMAEHCRASEKEDVKTSDRNKRGVGDWEATGREGATRLLKQHLHLLATLGETRAEAWDPFAQGHLRFKFQMEISGQVNKSMNAILKKKNKKQTN